VLLGDYQRFGRSCWQMSLDITLLTLTVLSQLSLVSAILIPMRATCLMLSTHGSLY
jgi:hypothetical protein